jgi:hypothetical protein
MLFRLLRWAIGRRGAITAEAAFEPLEFCHQWWVPGASYEAHCRGMHLLWTNLSPVQREQYDRFGSFEVIGGQTGRRYRINRGFQMNVQLLDPKRRPLCELCFMPEGNLVIGDVMLAQKLALELFESDALKAANKLSPDFYVAGFAR